MRVVTQCQTEGPESIKTKRIEIVVNGERREVPAELTLSEMLGWMEIDGGRVAVELNRAIVRQADWQSTPILEGSELEVVQFVGGG